MRSKYSVYSLFYTAIIVILSEQRCAQATGSSKPEGSWPTRSARTSLVSFHPFGQDVDMGLVFELPFLKMPIKKHKDTFGNEAALVNINGASLITSGVLAGGSLVVAYLLRSLGMSSSTSRETKDAAEEKSSREKRLVSSALESNAKSVFEYFKLVYKNDTGERVETTLPRLFARIEETFLENDIDLAACLQKSICSLVYRANEDVRMGRASSVQKIVDGISSFGWLLDALQPYSELRAAVAAGKRPSNVHCRSQYPNCKWHAPEQKLSELVKTYINFT